MKKGKSGKVIRQIMADKGIKNARVLHEIIINGPAFVSYNTVRNAMNGRQVGEDAFDVIFEALDYEKVFVPVKGEGNE